MARHKGFLETAIQGVAAIERLRDGDTVLMAEGCTHHRQCGDIGTMKLPAWINKYTGTEPEFVFTSGTEFPDDLAGFRLIVHCGGCMLGVREVLSRMRCAGDQGVPITNYGTCIAAMLGILPRALAPIPGMTELLESEK